MRTPLLSAPAWPLEASPLPRRAFGEPHLPQYAVSRAVAPLPHKTFGEHRLPPPAVGLATAIAVAAIAIAVAAALASALATVSRSSWSVRYSNPVPTRPDQTKLNTEHHTHMVYDMCCCLFCMSGRVGARDPTRPATQHKISTPHTFGV